MEVDYNKPSEYELKRLQRIKENHAFMKSLGLPVPKTPRLQQKPRPATSKGKKRKVFSSLDESESSESSDDSDEDWIPGMSEERAKRNKMIKRFIPEFRPKRNLLFDFNQKTSTKVGRPRKNQSTDDFEDLAEISDQMLNDASLFSDEESTEKEKPHPDPESRYPKRMRSMNASYREAEVPDDDHYLYCEECQDLYYGDCPNHGPLKAIPDNPRKLDGTLTAARASLPDFLEIKPSSIPNAGLGVFLKSGVIPKRSTFGPYQGTKMKLDDMFDETSYMWEIMKDGKFSHYVDGADEANANWMRFVNCSRCETEQNLVSYQYKGSIFYRTYKQITEGTELLVWYGDKYAEDLGISLGENQDDDQDDNAESLQCKTCKKTFPYANMLERHANNGCLRKDESKDVNCVLCDTKCQTPEEYNGHLLSVHCDLTAHIVCPICKTAWKRKDNFLDHLRTHSRYKPYKCTHCSKAFARQNVLKIHERLHTGVKPYKCTHCNKAFTVECNLKTHERIHSGVKPYKCTHCNKAFTDESNLKTHERIHTGVKPYKCTHCNKAFTQKGDLKTHERIHTGVKPYKCTHCNKAFSVQRNMKRHIKHIHEK